MVPVLPHGNINTIQFIVTIHISKGISLRFLDIGKMSWCNMTYHGLYSVMGDSVTGPKRPDGVNDHFEASKSR